MKKEETRIDHFAPSSPLITSNAYFERAHGFHQIFLRLLSNLWCFWIKIAGNYLFEKWQSEEVVGDRHKRRQGFMEHGIEMRASFKPQSTTNNTFTAPADHDWLLAAFIEAPAFTTLHHWATPNWHWREEAELYVCLRVLAGEGRGHTCESTVTTAISYGSPHTVRQMTSVYHRLPWTGLHFPSTATD